MEDYVAILKEAHQQLMSKDGTIAVTDLTLCHRKKVFSTIDPLPMTDTELYNFISGQVNHDIIERHFMLYPTRFKSEMQIKYKQVTGKIDIFDKKLSNVLDIKTSKSTQILLEPFKFHAEQVKFYMAMTDSDEGQIIYQMNNLGRYLAFAIYMTSEERKKQLEKLESEAKALLTAINVGDPSIVDGIYNDNDMKWMCRQCAYREKCRTIQDRDVNTAGAA